MQALSELHLTPKAKAMVQKEARYAASQVGARGIAP